MAPFAKSSANRAKGASQLMPDLDRREVAAIFCGGIAGSLLRVWLGREFPAGVADWPWTIFAINVSGSFVLACIATHIQQLMRPSYLAPLIGVGFCGAYTTFSTMQIEILQMVDHGRYGLAVAYALCSVLAGYLAISAGTALVRHSGARS
jgi:fluoride exporter